QLIRGLEASSILPGLRTQQEIEDLRMYLEWRATVGNPGPLDRLSRFRSAASSSSLTPHPTSFGTAAGNVASELGRGLLVQELLSFGPCLMNQRNQVDTAHIYLDERERLGMLAPLSPLAGVRVAHADYELSSSSLIVPSSNAIRRVASRQV